MTFRATPIHAIELNGLKGWGFSVFMDREDGANEQPETATKQRENVPSQHEVTDCTGPGIAVGAKQQCDTLNVTRPGEQRPPHSEQARDLPALAADPVQSLGNRAGSADQFNNTGPHVFSDQEPVE